MSIYSIDFAKRVVQLLPPDKRMGKHVAWMKTLMKPLQWFRDLWFGEYLTGTTAAPWNSGVTYAKYARVRYSKSVYESLVDDNLNKVPTDTAFWMQVQENFIGLQERIQYNGQKLVLEFALNKWFDTTFRQPPAQPDIYITRNQISQPVFRVAGDEEASSASFGNGSTEFVINQYSFASQPNFTINIPTAVYNSLDPSGQNNENIIRDFANRYVPAGLLYTIQTY